ncbi:MAG: acyltransferase [Clostridiales bacterium]|nr:acyltransferase [Clostridiales bacterium]
MEKLQIHFRPYQEAPVPRRIDVLDGIRVLCVLLVGWFHIWQQSWLSPSFTIGSQHISLDFLLRSGYIWVDGLLLLSGFLLYLPYAQAQSRPPKILPFYKKRLIRILPSYLLCILPLYALALINGSYPTFKDSVKDLLAHVTFTHTLFPFSYNSTPLNGALWTLGIEMQFYFLFPFLARAFKKFPLLTYLGMAGMALGFRHFASAQPDTSMYFNQLPAFLDVYANGFLAASAFSALRKKLGNGCWDRQVKLFFSVMLILCAVQLVNFARGQAGENGYESIRLGQMERRFSMSVTLSCAMICAACAGSGVRFLLGNKVMQYLSSISFQFYIYHQLFAVQLKKWGFPPSEHASPWMNGDYNWQLSYTLACFIGAIVLATLITYLFELPIARRLRRNVDAK